MKRKASKTYLKEIYRGLLLSDVDLQAKIAKATGKTIESAKRWARNNHFFLGTPAVVDCVRIHFGLGADEELTEVIGENADAILV